MGQDFFKYLPSEITIDILARLCIQTIISCKLVCKPWLDLLTTREFVKSHLSKSVPGLAIYQPKSVSKPYKIIEFVNDLSDEDSWNIINYDFPFHVPLLGSANGLLLLQCADSDPFLCNPITREYVTLLSPHTTHPMIRIEKYGFGVSKMSGEYKVVRIFIEESPSKYQDGCQVYTIGTRLWRRIACHKPLKLCKTIGVFLDGNLHWMVSKGSSWRIRSLDLETELFSSFSAPPLDFPSKLGRLSVLTDCLCLCESSVDESASDYEITIWLLKEYGDEKSWTKKFSIHRIYTGDFSSYLPYLRPIKVFEDGSILIEWKYGTALYCIKTKSIEEVYQLKSGIRSFCITTPSFLPLKTFAMENVSSF